jgi:ABC-type uncharacterized transport system involved in gliding motility auxiliary subunit
LGEIDLGETGEPEDDDEIDLGETGEPEDDDEIDLGEPEPDDELDLGTAEVVEDDDIPHVLGGHGEIDLGEAAERDDELDLGAPRVVEDDGLPSVLGGHDEIDLGEATQPEPDDELDLGAPSDPQARGGAVDTTGGPEAYGELDFGDAEEEQSPGYARSYREPETHAEADSYGEADLGIEEPAAPQATATDESDEFDLGVPSEPEGDLDFGSKPDSLPAVLGGVSSAPPAAAPKAPTPAPAARVPAASATPADVAAPAPSTANINLDAAIARPRHHERKAAASARRAPAPQQGAPDFGGELAPSRKRPAKAAPASKQEQAAAIALGDGPAPSRRKRPAPAQPSATPAASRKRKSAGIDLADEPAPQTRKQKRRVAIDLADDPRAAEMLAEREAPPPSQQQPAPQSHAHAPMSRRGPEPAQAETRPSPAPLRPWLELPTKVRWILTGVTAAVVLLAVPLVLLFVAGEEDPRARTCRDGTLTVLTSAPTKIEATLYAPAGDSDLAPTVERLDAILKDYADNAERFDYYLVDSDDASAVSRAKELGLRAVTAEGNDGPPRIFGLIIEAGDAHETLRLHPSVDVDHVTFALSSAIRSVIAKVAGTTAVIGLLTGIDELGLTAGDLNKPKPGIKQPSLRDILKRQFPYYEFREIALGGPTLDELEPVQTLIITQPGRELTGRERRQIDEFMMMGGKSLIVIASAVNVSRSDPHMTAILEQYGLQQLLAGYGMDMQSDVVFDPKLAGEYPYGGNKTVSVPAIIVATSDPQAPEDAPQVLDTSFGPFSPIGELALPFASTIVLEPRKQPGAQLRAVITSSPEAFAEQHGTTLSPEGSPSKPKGETQRRVLAATLEGSITSAFSAQRARGRILVISSSQFVTNPIARAAANNQDPMLDALSRAYSLRHVNNSVLALKGMLDWAGATEELLACSAYAKTE